MKTDDRAYAERLEQTAWWKRILGVQRPYRWHLRRLQLGLVLDVGCGVGRTLNNLGGHAVGVDHNPHSVEACRRRGFEAYTPDELRRSPHARPGRFDSLLLAHVAEHMREAEAVALLGSYLDLVRAGGRVVVITPQEAGYASDPTHVELMDFDKVTRIVEAADCAVDSRYSFPFPRLAGRLFRYNEFVVLGRKR
jgi:SAM-dependent methyltransferase